MILVEAPTHVEEEVAEKLFSWQRRCTACGGTFDLHIHHRIFRSEHEAGVRDFLMKAIPVYEQSYGRRLDFWYLHSIQNLVVLCRACHEGDNGRGIHGGNEKLHMQIKWSFTDPNTGFNVPFLKRKNLFAVTV